MSKLVRVSGAIIERHGKILIIRKRGKYRWSLPGGRAEPGEDPMATLRRALGDEFNGLKIIGSPEVFRHFKSSDNNHREVIIFLVEIKGAAVPNLEEIAEAEWVSEPFAENYDLPSEEVRSFLALRMAKHRNRPPQILD